MSRDLSRFGLHYFSNEDHFTQADSSSWGPKLTSLGISWLTLVASEQRAIPEAFLRSLIECAIEPIIHIPVRLGSLSLREIAPILKSYADWGVQYVVIYDRPNMQSAWNPADWSRGELVGRFTDQLLPILHVEHEIGLKPMLPPLEPGGDYWDTVFLEAYLSTIQRRSQSQLLKESGMALYSWTYGRPLNWGAGGPEAWPETKPYQSPEGSENHIGFRIFEWYQAIAKRAVGLDLPMFVLAGGYCPGVQEKIEDPLAIQAEIFEQLQSRQIPEYLRCFNFNAFTPDIHSDAVWFKQDKSNGPLAETILKTRREQRKSVLAHLPKTIEHYVLFPPSGTQDAIKTWETMAPFAMAVQPTFGFSVEEATHARKVTILADPNDLSLEIEQQLEDSGCDVSRIDVQNDGKLIDAITAFSMKNDQAGGYND
jgi:hypothetical protein